MEQVLAVEKHMAELKEASNALISNLILLTLKHLWRDAQLLQVHGKSPCNFRALHFTLFQPLRNLNFQPEILPDILFVRL